jgi:hypothetical protein
MVDHVSSSHDGNNCGCCGGVQGHRPFPRHTDWRVLSCRYLTLLTLPSANKKKAFAAIPDDVK